MMLVDALDNVIDAMTGDPTFAHFVMDGQAVPIDDYLAVRPHRRAQISKLVQEGRFHIGPWYTLADAFSVTPECLVRNLLYGHRLSRSLGGVMKFGYSVFSFGQTAQLPQLYAGFGIEDVITYKHPDKSKLPKSEFWWEAPDGSRVLTSRLGRDARWNFYMHFTVPVMLGGRMHGRREEWFSEFGNGKRVCHMVDGRFSKYHAIELDRDVRIRKELLQESINNAIQSCAPDTLCDEVLLMFDGCDFSKPLAESPEALRQANAACGDLAVMFHSTPMAYFTELRQKLNLDRLLVYRGEMRAGPVDAVHSESMSANIEVLRSLMDAERCLLGVAEPLAAFASVLGEPYPHEMFDLCWRYLLQAQAHDSVHALGWPKLKKDNLYRIDQAREIAEVLARQAFEGLVAHLDTSPMEANDLMLTVFNPSPTPRTEVVELQLDFPRSDHVGEWWLETIEGTRLESFPLGRPVGTHIPMVTPECRAKPIYVDRVRADVLVPDVPGFGYRTFRIGRVQDTRRFTFESFSSGEYPYAPIAGQPDCLDNGLVRVEVNSDGTIALTDHETAQEFGRLVQYVDSGCRGDAWVHHAPDDDVVVPSVGGPTQISFVRDSGLRATIAVTSVMNLPVSLTEGREARRRETVTTEVRTEITLTRGSKRVDIRTTFENRVRDHFFRVRIPTGVSTDSCWADAPFDVCERTFTFSNHHGLRGPELARQTMVSWVDVSDGRDRGLALFCRTNKEFGLEPQDGNATIVLSLLRAVDGTFPMDPYVMVEVTDPFAQCLGEQTFEYALLPHSGDWRSAQLPQLCAQYLSPCVAMELSKGSREGSLPLGQASLFRFERSQVCFSGVKPSEDGLSWIIRVFNPTDETVSDVLVLLRRPSAVQEVRLDETPIRDIPIADDGAVPLKVLPHRILTCAVRFGEYPLR